MNTHIAILTFDGFNELDSLIALGLLNRVRQTGWRVTLCCPTPSVTSMNGVTVQAQSGLADACEASAVIIGSGVRTREIAADSSIMAALQLDPARQTHRRAVLGHAAAGQARAARQCTGVHRSDDQTLGDRGRREGLESTVPCHGQCRHGRRLLGRAVSGRMDHRAHRGPCGSEECASLRGTGRRKRRIRRACDEARRTLRDVGARGMTPCAQQRETHARYDRRSPHRAGRL